MHSFLSANRYFFVPMGICLILFPCLGCTTEPVKDQFYVEGNCKTCQSIIESKTLELEGVMEAHWDYPTSFLTIIFFDRKISLESIQQHLASEGFETQYYPASQEKRSKLPQCCQKPINRELKMPANVDLPPH